MNMSNEIQSGVGFVDLEIVICSIIFQEFPTSFLGDFLLNKIDNGWTGWRIRAGVE